MALRTKNRKTSAKKTPKNKLNSTSQTNRTQPLTQHIKELRYRLFLAVALSIVVGSLVYYFHDFFIELVMAPLRGQKLIYLTPLGGFSFIFMVTFYVTMLLVLPFVLYQIYAFIRPAIPMHTSRLSLKIGFAAVALMAAGATFGYLFAVPAGLDFLSGFASGYVTPSLTADSYLNFVLGYVFGIGVLFELPLLLLFWHWIHPLTPKGLLNSERFVIVGAFIAAAILSPSPDILSQTIIAVPIIVIYQLGVVAVMISIRKARRLKEKEMRTTQSQTRNTEPRIEESPREALHVSPQAVAMSPRPIHRKTVSIDGMVVSRPATEVKQKTVPSSAPAPTPLRSRPTLVVPRRARVISDFGPIRSSTVDTSR